MAGMVIAGKRKHHNDPIKESSKFAIQGFI
jgi:hypothetical protein